MVFLFDVGAYAAESGVVEGFAGEDLGACYGGAGEATGEDV